MDSDVTVEGPALKYKVDVLSGALIKISWPSCVLLPGPDNLYKKGVIVIVGVTVIVGVMDGVIDIVGVMEGVIDIVGVMEGVIVTVGV